MICFNEMMNRPTLALHSEGHAIGDLIKSVGLAQFYSLAWLFRDLNEIAKLSPDEAFAEGWVVAKTNHFDLNGQMLNLTVSRYLDADPKLDLGAPVMSEAK